MILAAVRALLISQSSITAVVPASRIYGSFLPQNICTKMDPNPAIVVRVVDSMLQGQSLAGDKAGFNSLVTIDCYSTIGHIQSDSIAMEMYKKPILGYRGTPAGVSGMTISGIKGEGSLDQAIDGTEPASDNRRFVTSVDLEVIWNTL